MKKEHISGTYKYCGAVINPFVRTDTCHFKMYVQRPQRPDKYLSAVDKGGSGWTHTACPYTRPSESRMSTVEFEKKDMGVVLHCLGTIADQKWKKVIYLLLSLQYFEFKEQIFRGSVNYVRDILLYHGS